MPDTLDIRIELEDGKTLEGSHWMEELQSQLQQELEVACQAETEVAPDNTMSADAITTAISIGGFALSTIGMLLTILDHRRKISHRTSLTVTGENYTYTVTNLTDEEREKILQDLEKKNLKDVTVKVNK